MSSVPASGLKRFLFWDYPRTSWQYDLMVALILGFIFLTPREVFHDQPKISDIVRLPAEHGTDVFWVEPQLLAQVPESRRSAKVEDILRSRFGRRIQLVRLEPITGSEEEIKGFMAFTKP